MFKKKLNYYVYYSKGTNHDNADDVAITEARSLKLAILKFSEYYANVTKDQVQKVDLYRKDYVKGIQIISNY